jgi:hypothetical protein
MENWFIAKMVFQIICGDGKHRPQFEEQWRLIKANDNCEAVQKAQEMAQVESGSEVAISLPVQWRFVSLAEIIPLTMLTDGVELLAITREPYDQQDYLQHVCSSHSFNDNFNARSVNSFICFQP